MLRFDWDCDLVFTAGQTGAELDATNLNETPPVINSVHHHVTITANTKLVPY